MLQEPTQELRIQQRIFDEVKMLPCFYTPISRVVVLIGCGVGYLEEKVHLNAKGYIFFSEVLRKLSNFPSDYEYPMSIQFLKQLAVYVKHYKGIEASQRYLEFVDMYCRELQKKPLGFKEKN